MWFGSKLKPADQQQEKALERLAIGDSAHEIAMDLGVSHPTISRLNRKH